MPVHFYLGKDLQGRESEPVFHQEIDAIQRISQHLWMKLGPLPDVYAVVVNVQRIGVGQELSPDMVIISELGLGVVEFKDSFGKINCRDPFGPWYAGPKEIMSFDKTGTDEKGQRQKYPNPAIQVRTYAQAIRHHLLSAHPRRWLPGDHPYWSRMKIHTAVCFTNLLADINGCKQNIIAYYPPAKVLEAWEVLSILTPAEITEWAFGLRFDVQTGHTDFYRPLRLSPDEVLMLASQFFGGEPWEKIMGYIHSGLEPYAYLSILDGSDQATFCYHLEHDDTLIGRDAETCTLVIPGSYRSVSRKHARLVHTAEGVFVEDAGSLHGTSLANVPVTKRERLEPGAIIQLGSADSKTYCRLKFTLEPPIPFLPTETTQ